MASKAIKMACMYTGSLAKQKNKLRRHSALLRKRSTGKRPRAVGSHSEIPTAAGSGETAQMLSAVVGMEKK
jgi:hypothetical protein